MRAAISLANHHKAAHKSTTLHCKVCRCFTTTAAHKLLGSLANPNTLPKTKPSLKPRCLANLPAAGAGAVGGLFGLIWHHAHRECAERVLRACAAPHGCARRLLHPHRLCVRPGARPVLAPAGQLGSCVHVNKTQQTHRPARVVAACNRPGLCTAEMQPCRLQQRA